MSFTVVEARVRQRRTSGGPASGPSGIPGGSLVLAAGGQPGRRHRSRRRVVDPQGLTNVNGTLYFGAIDPTAGRRLWKSDGTAAGTTLVKNLDPVRSFRVSEITPVGGTVFFRA